MASTPATQDDFERLLGIVLPAGGATVSMIEAYLNESGTHPGSPVVCVAGYVFDKDRAIKFDIEWRAVLNIYHLPFFRMSSCAHGAEPFRHLSLEDRAALEWNMIAITNKWMSLGLAMTVQPGGGEGALPVEEDGRVNPFRCAAEFCLEGVRRGLEARKIEGECAYFFESGHRTCDQANSLMNNVFLDAKSRKAHRYASHSFIGKSIATPLQAADLLAWHWYADRNRQLRGETIARPGTLSLFEGNRGADYCLVHMDNTSIRHK